MNIKAKNPAKHVFLDNREAIQDWLSEVGITDYTIDEQLVVNVNKSILVADKNIPYLPVQFGEIKGHFFFQNVGLKSLKGFPHTVKGRVSVVNNKLKSFRYSPDTITGDYAVNGNKFESFKNLRTKIGGVFFCHDNPLKNIDDISFEVGGQIFFRPPAYADNFQEYNVGNILGENNPDVAMSFEQFLQKIALRKLSEKLDNTLPENEENNEQSSEHMKKLKI